MCVLPIQNMMFFHRHVVDSQGNLLDESVFDPDDARRCPVNRWDFTNKPWGVGFM